VRGAACDGGSKDCTGTCETAVMMYVVKTTVTAGDDDVGMMYVVSFVVEG